MLLLLGFVGAGIQLSVIGPALPDLSNRTGNSISEYSAIFVTRAIGYTIGAFSAIYISDRFEVMFVGSVCYFFNATFVFLLIFSTKLWHVAGILSFDGLTMAILDTGNVYSFQCCCK